MDEKTYTICQIDEFGSAVPDVSTADFEADGFSLGDVLSIRLDSGRVLEKVPYFNGYFTRPGTPVMVAYPGFPKPFLDMNDPTKECFEDLYPGGHLAVSVSEKGGCREIIEMHAVTYTNDPADFKSPEAFANAREIRAGRIAPKMLFRCASPYDMLLSRPPVVAAFLEKNGVRTTFSLSESAGSLVKRYPDMPAYSKRIVDAACAIPVSVGGKFLTEEYQQKIAGGLRQLLELPLPCAVHCLEGKDRTGFVCLLLESLMGASYQEMEADYMMTYENYYGITLKDTPEKYGYFREMFFDDKLYGLSGYSEKDLRQADFQPYAEAYLRSGGMTPAEIAALQQRLSGK